MSGHERERLSAYIDRELPPGERAAVEAHLAACPECAALLAELAAADEAAASLPAEAPDGYFEAFPGRVRARLEARRAAVPPARRVPVWTWAAAAALLLGVVAPLTLRQLRSPSVAAPSAVDAVRPSAPAGPEPAATTGAGPSAPTPGPARVVPREKRENAAPAPAPALAQGAPEARGARDEAPVREADASREKAVASAGVAAETASAPEAEDAFRRLESARPRSAGEWRRLRDRWTAVAAAEADPVRADEARVRAIAAAREAWRAGGDESDAAAFRREAEAYLRRADARQKPRVEGLLAEP